jgi:hypothetical protein
VIHKVLQWGNGMTQVLFNYWSLRLPKVRKILRTWRLFENAAFIRLSSTFVKCEVVASLMNFRLQGTKIVKSHSSLNTIYLILDLGVDVLRPTKVKTQTENIAIETRAQARILACNPSWTKRLQCTQHVGHSP